MASSNQPVPALVRAVRSRYTSATVCGTGTWGAVSACWPGYGIRLHETQQDAAETITRPCGANPCRGQHRVEHFRPLREFRHKMDTERD